MNAIEVRGARWSEIEIDAIEREGVWTIPASRMKKDREQRVPLSVQAVGILDRARALQRGRRELVFDTGRGEINVTTWIKLLQGLKIDAVPHGFRSSFSSWCGDTAQNEDLREAALAHFNKDRIAGVYQRSDLLERRRALMQEWSNYIAPLVRAHPPAPTEPEAPRVRRAPPPSYSPDFHNAHSALYGGGCIGARPCSISTTQYCHRPLWLRTSHRTRRSSSNSASLGS